MEHEAKVTAKAGLFSSILNCKLDQIALEEKFVLQLISCESLALSLSYYIEFARVVMS